MSKPTALILAGNYNQYISCLRAYRLDRDTARYITERWDIQGIEHKSVIVYCYGQYWQNRIYQHRDTYYWLINVLATEVVYQDENSQKEVNTMATVVISADYETQTHEYADAKDLTIMVDGRIVYQSTKVKGTAGGVFIGGNVSSGTVIVTGDSNVTGVITGVNRGNIVWNTSMGSDLNQTTIITGNDNDNLK